jgi:(p)ppGpp synthase/HD superfamily hydrolase
MPRLEETIDLVRVAHFGQRDQAGKPYEEHPIRVMRLVQAHLQTLPDGYLTPEEQEDILHAAAGHDFFEDTYIDAEFLLRAGYRPAVSERIEVLTRRKGDGLDYQQKIEQIVQTGDIGVILIKFYDNTDNLDADRQSLLPETKRKADRIRQYERSKEALWAAYQKIIAQVCDL